jgi:hypothetical protein
VKNGFHLGSHSLFGQGRMKKVVVPSGSTTFFGWGSRIRTYASRSQSPLPYHLAIPHRRHHYCMPMGLMSCTIHEIFLFLFFEMNRIDVLLLVKKGRIFHIKVENVKSTPNLLG